MSLKDIELKNEYRSLIDNVVTDFYVPLLKQAKLYQRAVGFFSSSALVEISKGIAGLIKNGGKVQLIASPYLSEADVNAIRNGYKLRDEIIQNALIKELKAPQNEFEKSQLNLLVNLIADGILDIRIALTIKSNELGMYHEKMGIISDSEGNKVAFSGSMNESATAMAINYETIDVFCSWRDEQNRVSSKEKAFISIWENTEPNIETKEFKNVTDNMIKKYKTNNINLNSDLEAIINSELFLENVNQSNSIEIPESIELHKYQLEAIVEWEKQNFRGIFDMATGTGKTLTGLGAIVRLSKVLGGRFAAFIVCPYQHLVDQWVEDIISFGINPIIGYSTSPQKKWKKLLEDAIIDQKINVKNKNFFCFVCTNATFSSTFVQDQIKKIKGNALLVADEAHNFGAEYLNQTLTNTFSYRLALSATINRHNDVIGTDKIFEYFGNKCIEYTLERAILENKLTKYKYHPIITILNDTELSQYSELTFEMSKCLIKLKNGKIKLNEKGKRIALARSRVVAGAIDKIAKLEEYIEQYISDTHILIYCGATKVISEKQDYTTIDEDDIRQIDVVTDLLGNKLNMKVSQFTSKEDNVERAILKNEFASGSNLQALIAIRCLDEGVNIPKIKTAFILASTTNPKEYIQRRGRVLRLSEGKEYAEIFDFVTLPRALDTVNSLTEEQMKKDITLVKNELNRVQEFTRLSMNGIEGQKIIDDIREAYCLNETDYKNMEVYDE